MEIVSPLRAGRLARDQQFNSESRAGLGAGNTNHGRPRSPVELRFQDRQISYSGTNLGLESWRRDGQDRSEEHTSELQSRSDLVCRLLLEKKKKKTQ